MLEAKEQRREGQTVEIAVKKEEKWVGMMRPKRGHKVFEFLSGQLLELQPEDYEDDDTLAVAKGMAGGMRVSSRHRKVKVNPDAKYVSALNYRNALKKLIKHGLIKPV